MQSWMQITVTNSNFQKDWIEIFSLEIGLRL